MTQQEFRKRFKYSKTDLIASGGFADVYMAIDEMHKEKYYQQGASPGPRKVALKFYKLTGEKKYTLEREVNMAMSLQHPNICRYLERIELEQEDIHGDMTITHVAVMEYLDGGHIDTFRQRYPGHIDKLLIDVLHGIDHLHRQEKIHRDIKPSNVLGCYLKQDVLHNFAYEVVPAAFVDTSIAKKVDEVGCDTFTLKAGVQPGLLAGQYIVPAIKITDFGISKSLDSSPGMSSRLFGSKPYMAPEQIDEFTFGVDVKNEKGEAIRGIDTRVDIWSFGVMAYELITSNKLFPGIEDATDEQVRSRILKEDIASKIAVLDLKYQKLLKKCLVRKAEDRCNSCSELVSILSSKAAERDLFHEYYEMAQKYVATKELGKAKEEIQKALTIKPDQVEAKTMLDRIQNLLERAREYYRDASVHFTKKEYNETKTKLQQALDIYPFFTDALDLLDRAKKEIGSSNGIGGGKGDTEPWPKVEFDKQVLLARSCYERKEYIKAKTAVLAALALRPADAEMLVLRGKIEDALLPHPKSVNAPKAASKWKRFTNGMVDITVVVAISFLLTRLFGSASDFMTSSEWMSLWGKMVTISFVLYYTIFEATSGRTLGKIITGTKAVDKYGNRFGFETALLRSLIRICFAWIDQISIFSSVIVHDAFTLTKVVNFPKGSHDNNGGQEPQKIPSYYKVPIYAGCAFNLVFAFSTSATLALQGAFSITDENYIINFLLPEMPGLLLALILGLIMKPRSTPSLIDDAQTIYKGSANYFLDGVAIGGKLYLLKDKLIFRSHAFNMVDHEMEVPLDTIAGTKSYNVSGWAPTGLEILLKDGTNEKFVLNKRSLWKTTIEMAVRNRSTN